MKQRTIISIALMVLAALMAFAGTASATVLTSPEGTTYTSSIVATSTNSDLDGPAVTVQCSEVKVEGKVEGHGAGKNVNVPLTLMSFTGCNYSISVKVAGQLGINSSNNVTSTGAEISMATSVGTCIFTTNATSLGFVIEGTNAWWNINSSKIPRTGGNFLCGSSWTWTGSFDFTTPNDLWVD